MKINYWLVAGVVGLWLIFAFFVPSWFNNVTISGPWGDTFGAFSALINGIGFIALYTTIKLQRDGMEMQRQTMEMQRKSMDEQLSFNKDQHRETTFRFLYEHISVLERDMEGFSIGDSEGVKAVDYVQRFIQDNRASDKFDHTLNYLISLYKQFETYHYLLNDGMPTITGNQYVTLRDRVTAFRARYVSKIADTTVNPQQDGYAVKVHDICRHIVKMQEIL